MERSTTGVFNATGPAQPLTLGHVLETARTVSGSDATFTWVDEPFLLEHDVAYWQQLPAVLPESDRTHAGMARIDVSRAIGRGLAFRPLTETIRDTLAWHATRAPDHALKAGLSAERERELLAAWRARRG